MNVENSKAYGYFSNSVDYFGSTNDVLLCKWKSVEIFQYFTTTIYLLEYLAIERKY